MQHDQLTAENYKENFSLYKGNGLVSDQLSYSLEERGRSNIMRFNLQQPERKAELIRKVAETLKGKGRKGANNDEWKNRYGTCEKQIGFRLIEYIKHYKMLPSRSQKGEGSKIAKVLTRRYGSLNEGFKKYGLPTLYRQGTNVELNAPNGKQLFFNYNKGYSRDAVFGWMVAQCPMLDPNNINKFRD